MVHLIRWTCFITLLLSLILIVLFLYELQGSPWLRSIKVIGQCAFFMSFGWADSAGSPPLRRLGDQMLVAPTITLQSITELTEIENSNGSSYMRTKHTQIQTEHTEKAKCGLFLLGLFLAVSMCMGTFETCLDVWLKVGLLKTDVSELQSGDWSILMEAQMKLALPVFFN